MGNIIGKRVLSKSLSDIKRLGEGLKATFFCICREEGRGRIVLFLAIDVCEALNAFKSFLVTADVAN